MLETTKKLVPGTDQVKLNPMVTMGMTIFVYLVTSFTKIDPPPEVWVAVSGLISYGLQYWHGPRS